MTGGPSASGSNEQNKSPASLNVTPKPTKKTLKVSTGEKTGRPTKQPKEGEDVEKVKTGPKRVRSSTERRRISGSGTVKTFKCHLDSCGKIFNDRASLKKHMTVHGDKLVSQVKIFALSLRALNLFTHF